MTVVMLLQQEVMPFPHSSPLLSWLLLRYFDEVFIMYVSVLLPGSAWFHFWWSFGL